jgi:hypothetical protein
MNAIAHVILATACLAALAVTRMQASGSTLGGPLSAACASTPDLRLTSNTSLVLAEPMSDGTAQLCRYAAGRLTARLYRPLPTGDVDVSSSGGLLAYRAQSYRLHLVVIAAGTDRTLGPGVEPRFSHDDKYLAYVSGDSLPLPRAPEQLMVYAVATGKSVRVGPLALPRVGDGWDAASSLEVWSPKADDLTWSLVGTSQTGIRVASFAGDTTFRTGMLVTRNMVSDVAWSSDGRAVLYWSSAGNKTSKDDREMDLDLVRQVPPGGAPEVVITAQTGWIEGGAQAPIPGPSGSLYVSLLGLPRSGYDLLALYTPGKHSRTIVLSGEPRIARFSTNGALVVIWTPPYKSKIAGSHASLIDVQIGRVRDLGPAVAAFWTEN